MFLWDFQFRLGTYNFLGSKTFKVLAGILKKIEKNHISTYKQSLFHILLLLQLLSFNHHGATRLGAFNIQMIIDWLACLHIT